MACNAGPCGGGLVSQCQTFATFYSNHFSALLPSARFSLCGIVPHWPKKQERGCVIRVVDHATPDHMSYRDEYFDSEECCWEIYVYRSGGLLRSMSRTLALFSEREGRKIAGSFLHEIPYLYMKFVILRHMHTALCISSQGFEIIPSNSETVVSQEISLLGCHSGLFCGSTQDPPSRWEGLNHFRVITRLWYLACD